MNKKQIIQIIVIVAAFGASGFVLYNGLYKGNSAPVPVSSGQLLGGGAADPSKDIAVDKVLPYGDTLDFDRVLHKHGQQYGVIEYPKLDPNTEVGISPKQLIKVLPPSEK